MAILDSVIGLDKDVAMVQLVESGYQVRVVVKNGPPQRLIENYDIGRVTIEVLDGKVISVRAG